MSIKTIDKPTPILVFISNSDRVSIKIKKSAAKKTYNLKILIEIHKNLESIPNM
jgi:hypothetical protein